MATSEELLSRLEERFILGEISEEIYKEREKSPLGPRRTRGHAPALCLFRPRCQAK